MYALHFGIMPTQPGFTPSIYGHDDPAQSETLVDLSWIDPKRVDPKAYVSGSWACWGPDDQDTDGDNSLHVVVYVTEVTSDLVGRKNMYRLYLGAGFPQVKTPASIPSLGLAVSDGTYRLAV